MKIRFFNTYEPVSPLYRDVLPELAGNGAEVEVVISKAEYRKGRSITNFFQNTPNIRFLQTVNFGKHAYEGARFKLFVALLYTIHGGLYALFGPGADKNVFMTQPPFFTVFGYLLKYLRSQQYYCIIMDIQPEMSIAIGLAKERSLFTKFTERISKLALKHAEGIIVIGRCMAERVQGFGIKSERIHVIQNWADEREVYPIDRFENRLRKDMNWGGKFVVLYSGNIGIPQYFDDLLSVAKKLKHLKDILFVFIGEGSRKNYLAQRVKEEKLYNVELLPFLHERYSLAEILSSGDIHFVSLLETCTGLAVPSKTYAALASGRPILFQGSKSSEIARMMRESKIGFFIPLGNVKLLQACIEKLHDDSDLRKKMGKNARNIILEAYSRKVGIRKYVELLQQPL
jgi:glycosyltransferase involved in cell wall biosynthesis